MIGIELVVLGAILLFALARALRSQEPTSTPVEVRDDAAHREESLRRRRLLRGK